MRFGVSRETTHQRINAYAPPSARQRISGNVLHASDFVLPGRPEFALPNPETALPKVGVTGGRGPSTSLLTVKKQSRQRGTCAAGQEVS
ncbi:hypothetical protein [Rhodovastum atsumiense]|uniref:Uncharacterized protein n=1 Tax=Rhodovastum atsumiense TaxID=504468 RepID=A0A5M6IIH8_9PROT|nr:hypothetical protein [Rhodovastum atsumiense]KAA5608073.1 hypothetical protein F1189_30750 [Rhodovastum atsumiense]